MGGLPGTDGAVYAAAVDGSGNLYIGGNFTIVGDVLANWIAKWDGTNWSTLSSGMNGPVQALAISGNDLYAGGAFTTAGGSPAEVSALAVSGGDLYAGGWFKSAGGTPANVVVKWNGSTWAVLGSTIRRVRSLAVSDGAVYAGTAGGEHSSANIAKWDGNSLSWIAPGMDDNTLVSALAVSGTNLYAGLDFPIQLKR